MTTSQPQTPQTKDKDSYEAPSIREDPTRVFGDSATSETHENTGQPSSTSSQADAPSSNSASEPVSYLDYGSKKTQDATKDKASNKPLWLALGALVSLISGIIVFFAAPALFSYGAIVSALLFTVFLLFVATILGTWGGITGVIDLFGEKESGGAQVAAIVLFIVSSPIIVFFSAIAWVRLLGIWFAASF